jgi:hypothetical protein
MSNELAITLGNLQEAFCDVECRIIAAEKGQRGYHDEICWEARAALTRLKDVMKIDSLDEMKAQRDELAEVLQSILDFMPDAWRNDEKAWPIGLLDLARSRLAKMAVLR